MPLYELAITLFPPLAVVRYPSKAMAVVALVWALLCGIGSDAMRGLFLLGLYPPHLRRLVEWRERAEGTFESLLAEPIRAYRVPDPQPRVYGVTGVRVASAADAPAVVSSAGFDRRREVVLGGGAPRSPTAGRQDCRLVSFLSDRLDVEVEMSDPGHRVVLETYDPGWQASVGERDAPVLPANGAFLAVRVPAGRHLVSSLKSSTQAG